MKISLLLTVIVFNLLPYRLPVQSNRAQGKNSKSSVHKNVTKNRYTDVHHLGAGKVTYADAKARAKDMATEKNLVSASSNIGLIKKKIPFIAFLPLPISKLF